MNHNLDRIHIRDLLLRCIIGVNDFERKDRQDVIINITLYADLRKSSSTDSIEDTVDYRAVTKKVIEVVENSQYYLVEALADHIARVCLSFEGVEKVDVTVEKPGALRFSRSVGVEITRTRDDYD